jgi:hypothetical protein
MAVVYPHPDPWVQLIRQGAAMAAPTLCFDTFDPVTGGPDMDQVTHQPINPGNRPDGNTGIDDALVFQFESPDPGYTNGSEASLGGSDGTTSGLPPVIIKAVRAGQFLHLAVFCRFDPSFENEDAVVVAMRPDFVSQDQNTCRRIDIFPVWKGVPGAANEASPGVPDNAGPTFDSPPDQATVHYQVRANKAPRMITHYLGQASGGDPWTKQSRANPSAPYLPTNLSCGVRSWIGSPNGGGVDNAWAVELRLPIDKLGGGADWIDLTGQFGLYINVLRVNSISGIPTTHNLFATEFTFANGSAYLTGTLDGTTSIPTGAYGKGVIPGFPGATPADCGPGVRFVTGFGDPKGELSVGVRIGGGPLGHEIVGAWSAQPGDNEFVALVENTDTTTTPSVTARFRLADWGLTTPPDPAHSGAVRWVDPPGATPAQAKPVPAGQTVEITSLWPRANVPSFYNTDITRHQCIWVQLEPGDGTPVIFTRSSVRRNFDFKQFSQVSQPATISGAGYPRAASGKHDFLLFTTARSQRIPRGGGELASRFEPQGIAGIAAQGEQQFDQIWLWIVHGYRRTGQTITIGGRTCEILDDSPGAFGYVGPHVGVDDALRSRISGPGVRGHGRGVYSVQVPDGGSVVVDTVVSVGQAAPGGEPTGVLDWLVRLIRKLLGG